MVTQLHLQSITSDAFYIVQLLSSVCAAPVPECAALFNMARGDLHDEVPTFRDSLTGCGMYHVIHFALCELWLHQFAFVTATMASLPP